MENSVIGVYITIYERITQGKLWGTAVYYTQTPSNKDTHSHTFKANYNISDLEVRYDKRHSVHMIYFYLLKRIHHYKQGNTLCSLQINLFIVLGINVCVFV